MSGVNPPLAQWIAEQVRTKRVSSTKSAPTMVCAFVCAAWSSCTLVFLDQCRALHLSSADYPFNTDHMGIRSLAAAVRAECLRTFERGARLAGASHLKGLPNQTRSAPARHAGHCEREEADQRHGRQSKRLRSRQCHQHHRPTDRRARGNPLRPTPCTSSPARQSLQNQREKVGTALQLSTAESSRFGTPTSPVNIQSARTVVLFFVNEFLAEPSAIGSAAPDQNRRRPRKPAATRPIASSIEMDGSGTRAVTTNR